MKNYFSSIQIILHLKFFFITLVYLTTFKHLTAVRDVVAV